MVVAALPATFALLLSGPALAQQPPAALPEEEQEPESPPPGGSRPSPRRPWRLDDLVAELPWLRLGARQRTRFETLHSQFRADATLADDDQQWFTRTSVRADVDFDSFGATLEIMDSRAFGAGDDGFASNATVNTTDVVQAFASVPLGVLGNGRHRLLAGRYTMSLGSRRFVIRNVYRNTVNNFTGIDWLWQNDDGEVVRAFWTMPVRRRPTDAGSLRDNEFEWDDQDLDRQFFGVFASRRLDQRTAFEPYVFVLREDERGSAMRELYTPGIRIARSPARGDWFAEAELAVQVGESRLAANGPMLDHGAWFGHASAGYRFDVDWEPTIRASYDHATGDRHPTDTSNDRFDSLFGAPRFEYGPTGLWGVMQRSNMTSPGLEVTLRPTEATWMLFGWRDFRLASARDEWVGSGVVDPTGASGDRVGHLFELRTRWDFLPQNAFVEIGGAYLISGGFADRAPNARGGDSCYGYVEVVWIL